MHEVKEKIDEVIEKALAFLETVIAIISVIVLFMLLATELTRMFTEPTYFEGEGAVSTYLHDMLTIVVALEFIKLLLHLTPANILEVLIMAISRSIIVDHSSALDNLLSIACIIGLFAAKRYLIPKAELHKDIDEDVAESHHHRRHKHHKHHKHEPKTEEKQPETTQP